MSLSPVSLEHDGLTIGCQLELQIEASNLANMDVFSLSDPFALLEEQKNGKWVEVGKLRSRFAARELRKNASRYNVSNN